MAAVALLLNLRNSGSDAIDKVAVTHLWLYAHDMCPVRFLSACVWFRDVTSFSDASGMACVRVEPVSTLTHQIRCSDSLSRENCQIRTWIQELCSRWGVRLWKSASGHLWWQPEVTGVTFSDSDSAPVPKFFNPGPAIFQIWESDSCSDCGYRHRSNRNLPRFLHKKLPHRLPLLPEQWWALDWTWFGLEPDYSKFCWIWIGPGV